MQSVDRKSVRSCIAIIKATGAKVVNGNPSNEDGKNRSNRYSLSKSKTCLLYYKESYQKRLIYKKSRVGRLITVMKTVKIDEADTAQLRENMPFV